MSEHGIFRNGDWVPLDQPCPLPREAWPRIAAAFHLTEREVEVVRGLFEGDRQGMIARRLGISAHTVHTHLGRVYKKLEVTNRSGLFLRVFSAFVEGPAPGHPMPSTAMGSAAMPPYGPIG